MPNIRPISICLLERDGRLLVQESIALKNGRHWYRPPGGGIEHGETALAAVHREIMEELGAEICEVSQQYVLENIFEFEGQPKHEIVFVFTARFADPVFYQKESFLIVEPSFEDTVAVWMPIADFLNGKNQLYPSGLTGRLAIKRCG